MGAKTCKCNFSEDEEAQLKLSRDPGKKSKYDFPSAQDLSISALAGSSPSSNHLLPLPPKGIRECEEEKSHLAKEETLSRTGTDLAAAFRQSVENGPTAGKKNAKKHMIDMVYSGAAVDAALAMQAQQTRSLSSVSLDNGEDESVCLKDATVSDKNEHQLASGPAAKNFDAGGKPDSMKYTCWKMVENTSSCDCPFSKNSLELSRGIRSPSEHYDLHGTIGLAAPEHISASVFSPTNAEKQASCLDILDSERDDRLPPGSSGAQPLESALSSWHEGGSLGDNMKSPNADLRHIAQASGDFIVDGRGDGLERRDVDSTDSQLNTRVDCDMLPEGLDGEWLNEGQVNILQGTLIKFASGESCNVELTSKSNCRMIVQGIVYYGRLSADRKKLLWSDGDIWTRKEIQSPIKDDCSQLDTSGGAASKKHPSNVSKQSGKDKDAQNIDAAKQDGETKPKKGCCTIA